MLFTRSNVLEGLGSAEVCGVRQAAGLQVFGLKWPGANGHDYLTLDEALEQRTLEVTEVDAGGRVPTLKVANKSGRMVFLMAGRRARGRQAEPRAERQHDGSGEGRPARPGHLRRAWEGGV